MNVTTYSIAIGCTLVLGAGLWGGMATQFNARGQLDYKPNVACVKGSPYGKILALAMQGPIDFYWHEGASHEDTSILNQDAHEHDASCADGCDDHSGHDHAAAKSAHGEDCPCDAHGGKQENLKEGETGPLHLRAKRMIKKMAAYSRRKTDGQPLSPAHQKYLQGVVEDKLRFAYELDPSNYINYGNYHLFISTTSLGKSEGDDDRAVKLAMRTLDFCQEDDVDPESWLTAASAAYDIVSHIGRYYEQYTIPEAKESLAQFDVCLQQYVQLRDQALKNNRIVSEIRLDDMEARANSLTKLREGQGIYMKRVMTEKMSVN
ncbi:MAG: hypothetical protein KJO21_01415 [Verrucomicrobiae bacterium]|nr:hypothetical protein [Verrucomicrobiae bacterium]NNJ42193.1 hypothetical protein [Akkermansiaceae bacterium]